MIGSTRGEYHEQETDGVVLLTPSALHSQESQWVYDFDMHIDIVDRPNFVYP